MSRAAAKTPERPALWAQALLAVSIVFAMLSAALLIWA